MLSAIFSPMWLPTLLMLLPVLLTIFLKHKKHKQAANLPPMPPKLPILGHLHQWGALPHRSVRQLSQQYGPILMLQLGKIPTVIVSSADIAKEVMKTNDLDSCSRPQSPTPQLFSYNYADVVFSPYSDEWKGRRSLLIHEVLSMKRVQSFGYAKEAEIDKLITLLSQNLGNPVELDEKIYALVDGLIGTVAFGKIYGTENFDKQNFHKVLDESMNIMSSFSFGDFFPNIVGRTIDVLTGYRSTLKQIFQKLDGYFEGVIDAHLDPARPKPEGEDFVDIMIKFWQEPNDKFSFTRDHIKAMLMNTFFGATNTTSVTILWAMAKLIRHPRVMKKLQDEIRSTVGKKPRVDGVDIGKLKYLKMIVKETLRLHPPITLINPRETRRHCKLGGYDIPPKTRIFVNCWALGRDPKTWKNADEFYPERFEDSDIDFQGKHLEFIPFGAGRRICPGILMGSTNVEFILANLLYRFDWELPSGMKKEELSMDEEGKAIFHRKQPLYLVPTPYI